MDSGRRYALALALVGAGEAVVMQRGQVRGDGLWPTIRVGFGLGGCR
jgi:hypothetical protein